MVSCNSNRHSTAGAVERAKRQFILRRFIFFIQLFVFLTFIPSCAVQEKTMPLTHMNKKIFYTVKEYRMFHKKKLVHQDELTYIGLRTENFELFKKPFSEATKIEINNDIAYNRKFILLDKQYAEIIDYLKEEKNLLKLVKHLKYNKNDIKSIVYNDKQAIILLSGDSSYESFFIALDKEILKIKLVDYLYGY